jgi:hypothetical protein
VTHRLDTRKAADVMTIEFGGVLDEGAFEALRAAVVAAGAGGVRVRVILREGTDVERACVDGLRTLGAEVVAESAYLARWIRGETP